MKPKLRQTIPSNENFSHSETQAAQSFARPKELMATNAECCSELLILPDGRVLVRNLTPAVAMVLRESFQ